MLAFHMTDLAAYGPLYNMLVLLGARGCFKKYVDLPWLAVATVTAATSVVLCWVLSCFFGLCTMPFYFA